MNREPGPPMGNPRYAAAQGPANTARLRQNVLRYEIPTKWLLAAVGVVTLRVAPAPALTTLVSAYALVALLATVFFVGRWGVRPRQPQTAAGTVDWQGLYWVLQLADVLYVTALIAAGQGLASQLYLLYPLLALKSLVYGPDVPGIVWLPFLFGPLYVAGLWWAHGSLAFLADPAFLARYLLLLVLTVGIAVATWALSGRLSEIDRLQRALDARTRDLASQTHTLQRTATDLGDRVLELRSLQEVAKALSATLYLNETLNTITERLKQLTGSAYCAVMLLDGDLGNQTSGPASDASLLTVSTGAPTATADGGSEGSSREALWEGLARSRTLQRILDEGRSQVVSLEGQKEGELSAFASSWSLQALEVTPMMTRGQPIGALLVGLEQVGGERGLRRSLVESFAYFAATSVENARLYGDVAEKGRELEAVLAGIGDGVFVADTEHKLVLMNPVAAGIFGVQEPGLTLPQGLQPGTPLSDFLPSQELADLLAETSKGGRVLVKELPLASAGLSSDGEPRTFQAVSAPVYRSTEAGEQVSGVVTVLRDITAQKELERMKSNFLSVVSHELKTPLHSIKGFVDIILMGKTGPVSELQHDFLSTVQQQTGHLQRLIEDLLEFSRLESGQIRLRPAEVAPAELVADVVDKLSPLAGHKQLRLRSELPEDFPLVEADIMRLEQVLTNLVENAIKFTPEGGQVLIKGWDLGDAIELAVVDTGIGIPPEEHDRVFDRFYQVDSSARRRYKGTGLGLTICRHIVTQHGGRIWVQDHRHRSSVPSVDPGRATNGGSGEFPGSEFHFTLPKVLSQVSSSSAALDFGALTLR